MRVISLIEPLEDRIAPAVATQVTFSPDNKTATYKDAAGDIFTVTTTKGAFSAPMFNFSSTTQGLLNELDLTGRTDFNGANLAFAVAPAPGGSSVDNVGYIKATNVNLNNITLPGDLGRIDAGSSTKPLAINMLAVGSLGVVGAGQGTAAANITSNIKGTLGTLNVGGNVDGVLNVTDFSALGSGNINKLIVGGSIDGNTGSNAGSIDFTGKLGSAVITGGLEGGGGTFSGSIIGTLGTFASIGSLSINGAVPDDPLLGVDPGIVGTSMLGGSGGLSGLISAVNIGKISIAGNVVGGSGVASGSIQAGGLLGSVAIGGSLVGGNAPQGDTQTANSSGLVFGANIGTVVIGKSILGGSGFNSGEVQTPGTLQKLLVMGDVQGGSAGHASYPGSPAQGGLSGQAATGSIPGYAGAIRAATAKNITINGSLIGGTQGTLVDSNGTSQASADTGGALVISNSAGVISIGKNLQGGGGNASGSISVNGPVASLVIGGDIMGGTANNSGSLSTFGLLKTAVVKGSIIGSDNKTNPNTLTNTGYLQAAGIGSLTVDGSLTSGTAAGQGHLDTSGAIRSTISIGSLVIGSLDGNASNPAIISAVGLAKTTGSATSDVAIRSLTVRGNASYGDILAGYNTDTKNSTMPLGTGVNADAQIGAVTIDGNLTGTNIVAGVGGPFGSAAGAALSGAGVANLPTIISRISKIIVTGSIDAGAPGQSYGIAAQYVASARIGGLNPLQPGPSTDTFAAGKEQTLGGDLFVYEV